MSSTLFSQSWYRVAQLKPLLRGQAHWTRHHYRGLRWHVLQDRATGRFLRLNPEAYWMVGQMDGTRTVQSIWDEAVSLKGDDAPTQDEVQQLLAQLYQANVLVSDRQPDLDDLDDRRRQQFWQKFKQYLGNPLSLKFPLVDPDPLLKTLACLMPRGLLPWLALAWATWVGVAVFLAARHWDELSADVTTRIFAPENMGLMALAFPLLKAIHELGHGLMLRLFGKSCHEMGLMFLILIPVPYVDASQATALADKRQRMLVGLGGMMAELAVAALALFLWLSASPGMGKAFLHQILVAAGVTTIVFNANPLLRFDGYYVLADWLEIPNLAQRAQQYLSALVHRFGFGLRKESSLSQVHPPLTPREAPWLAGYAVTSFAYRMVVAVGIVMLVAQKFFFIGVGLALWSAWGTVGQPVVKMLKHLATHNGLEDRRWRAWLVSLGAVAGVVALLGLVPVTSATRAEGVIWMPEQSRVRTSHECFGMAVLVQPGERVVKGQHLLGCTDPELDTQVAQAEARRQELSARVGAAQVEDRVKTQVAQLELNVALQKLADLRKRRAELDVLSPADGQFVMPSPEDFPGRHFERGDQVAYVLDPAQFTLLSVVEQGDVARVRDETRSVELRASGNLGELLNARLVREVPAATNKLPSMALSLQGGGKLGIDPRQGEQGPQTLESVFQFELQLQGAQWPGRVGQRVYVKFVHAPEPLLKQWYRPIRQMFLKAFAT